MANSFYTPTGNPADSSFGASSTIRDEFSAIEDGFDILPTVTGNALEYLRINTGATAIETIVKDTSNTIVGLTDYKINFVNTAGTFTSYYINTNTASRDYTFQDRDGTIADDTDLALKANIDSETLTGVPLAPTAAPGTSTTQIATTAFALANSTTTFPNLLINSDFVVNQEAYAADGSASLADGDYGHDMWKADGGAVVYTKETNGDITIDSMTAVAAGDVDLVQKNDDLILTNGEELTLSINVVSLSSSLVISGNGLAAQTLSATGIQSFTFTSSGGGEIRFRHTFGGSGTYSPAFSFNSLKVERAGTATAYIKPEPRAERARCDWYYQKILTSSIFWFGFSNGSTVGNTLTLGNISPINPTGLVVSFTGAHTLLDSAAGLLSVSSVSSISVLGLSAISLSITTAVAPTGGFVSLYSTSGGGHYIELDARY